MVRFRLWLLIFLAICRLLPCLVANIAAQATSQAASPSSLAIETNPLPNAAPRHPYRFEFHARNGIPPFTWTLAKGEIPVGVKLGTDGVLTGAAIAAGLFHFTVQVTDSSQAPQTATRDVELKVVPPLLLEWKDYAKVSNNRIDGRVKVSNGTEDDFDLTFVVLAVAEDGRATAIGYQRFPLKHGTTSFELPFGETLPRGAYVVHVDTVAEVPEKDQIYRARLRTKDRLQVTVGP
jgi:putative Ig domain-containing protein